MLFFNHQNRALWRWMRNSLLVLLFLGWLGCSSGDAAIQPEEGDTTPPATDEVMPPADFVCVESVGHYSFLASVDNKTGGESVSLPTTYYIAKYAVTNSDWSQFVEATNRKSPKYWPEGRIPEGKAQHPVLWISYVEAEAYCQWLSEQHQDWAFRLPTQQEWEYAAIGQPQTAYPWGNHAATGYANGVLTSNFNYNGVIAAEMLKTSNRIATYNHPQSTRYGEQEPLSKILSLNPTGGVSGWVNHADYLGFIYTDIFTELNEDGGYTCAVDAYPEGVSWCGCYNMCGNCWEWTSSVEVAQNGAEKGELVQVIRGGSWYANGSSCKGSFRGEGRRPNSAYNTVGVRLVAIPK